MFWFGYILVMDILCIAIVLVVCNEKGMEQQKTK
jgi:hypothetical protein